MKYLIFALSILVSTNVFAQAKPAATPEAPEDIVLSRNCRKAEKACISMELDTLDKKIIVEQKKLGSETEFTLKVFGKLDRGAEKEHIVKYTASGEGNCSAFGKGTVAVLGFSNSGNPILFTEQGNLELTSKLQKVGSNNIQIVNSKNLKREGFLSKSKNIDNVSISRTHFDSSGNLYFIDGTECFEFRRYEMFRKVDIKRCESKKIEAKDLTIYEKIKFKENEKVYEIKDSSYLLVFDQNTCS